jgi:hypothetical protein
VPGHRARCALGLLITAAAAATAALSPLRAWRAAQEWNEDEFDHLFNPLVALVSLLDSQNDLSPVTSFESQCAGFLGDYNFDAATSKLEELMDEMKSEWDIEGCPVEGFYLRLLPATCSTETLRSAGGGCAFQIPLDNLLGVRDISAQVALSLCPDSLLPTLSVSLAGAGADKLFAPCVSDDQCGPDHSCRDVVRTLISLSDYGARTDYGQPAGGDPEDSDARDALEGDKFLETTVAILIRKLFGEAFQEMFDKTLFENEADLEDLKQTVMDEQLGKSALSWLRSFWDGIELEPGVGHVLPICLPRGGPADAGTGRPDAQFCWRSAGTCQNSGQNHVQRQCSDISAHVGISTWRPLAYGENFVVSRAFMQETCEFFGCELNSCPTECSAPAPSAASPGDVLIRNAYTLEVVEGCEGRLSHIVELQFTQTDQNRGFIPSWAAVGTSHTARLCFRPGDQGLDSYTSFLQHLSYGRQFPEFLRHAQAFCELDVSECREAGSVYQDSVEGIEAGVPSCTAEEQEVTIHWSQQGDTRGQLLPSLSPTPEFTAGNEGFIHDQDIIDSISRPGSTSLCFNPETSPNACEAAVQCLSAANLQTHFDGGEGQVRMSSCGTCAEDVRSWGVEEPHCTGASGISDPELDEMCAARLTNEYDNWYQCQYLAEASPLDEWGNQNGVEHTTGCEYFEHDGGLDVTDCADISLSGIEGAASSFQFNSQVYTCDPSGPGESGEDPSFYVQQDVTSSHDDWEVSVACISAGIPQLGLEGWLIRERARTEVPSDAMSADCSLTAMYNVLGIEPWNAVLPDGTSAFDLDQLQILNVAVPPGGMEDTLANIDCEGNCKKSCFLPTVLSSCCCSCC